MKIMLFIGLALGFTLIPGPNAMLIITTSLSHGTKRGLQVVAGISSAIAIQLIIAVYSTHWLVNTLGSELHWIKWFGFAFIFVLLAKTLWNHFKDEPTPTPSGTVTFSRGLAVALTNPKAFIFFAAILIPFVDTRMPYQQQVILLSLIFWFVVNICDIHYAIFAVQFKRQIQHSRWRIQRGKLKSLLTKVRAFIARASLVSSFTRASKQEVD